MINYLTYKSCKRESPLEEADFSNDFPIFKFLPASAGRSIGYGSEFYPQNYELRNWEKSITTGALSQISANEYSKRSDFSDSSCDDFPIHEEFFVAFQMRLRGVSRLGWLKVVYKASNKLSILETAIQK